MPGVGESALFTFTIVKSMGLSPYQALASVFCAGILFSMVALTPLAKTLTVSIPDTLKNAISVGIGLFITFVGFQKSGLNSSQPINSSFFRKFKRSSSISIYTIYAYNTLFIY